MVKKMAEQVLPIQPPFRFCVKKFFYSADAVSASAVAASSAISAASKVT